MKMAAVEFARSGYFQSRYSEGPPVPLATCATDERSFGVPQDDGLCGLRMIRDLATSHGTSAGGGPPAAACPSRFTFHGTDPRQAGGYMTTSRPSAAP